MSLRLTHVPPARLHEFWPLVRPGLDECRAQDTDEVWLEDIYACIRAGTAYLYVGLDARNNGYYGFVLLTTRTDTFSGRSYLHVWFCNNSGGHDILREGMPQLEQIASQMGASKITYRANRLSFERLTRDLGFRVHDIEFVKDL